MLAASIGAYAYFSTTGAGSGSGTVGTSTALVVNQAGISYSSPENALLPGTSATVNFTVDNPSTGHQQLGTIAVSSITTDLAHAGCDSTNPTWFSTNTDVVNHDYAPGNTQIVAGTITITFNNLNVNQDVCKGAPLTFHYSA
jgi:hypothetical protein